MAALRAVATAGLLVVGRECALVGVKAVSTAVRWAVCSVGGWAEQWAGWTDGTMAAR